MKFGYQVLSTVLECVMFVFVAVIVLVLLLVLFVQRFTYVEICEIIIKYYKEICKQRSYCTSHIHQHTCQQQHNSNRSRQYNLLKKTTHVPRNSRTSSGSIPSANFSSSTPNICNCSDLLFVASSSAVSVARNGDGAHLLTLWVVVVTAA